MYSLGTLAGAWVEIHERVKTDKQKEWSTISLYLLLVYRVSFTEPNKLEKTWLPKKRQDGNIKIQGVAAKIYYEFIIKWIWLFSAIKSFFFKLHEIQVQQWICMIFMNMCDTHEYVWYSWICIFMNMYIMKMYDIHEFSNSQKVLWSL